MPLGGKQQGGGRDLAAKGKLRAIIFANVVAMFEASDNPEEMKSSLTQSLLSSPWQARTTAHVLRKGWEEALAAQQSNVVNIAVVAALLISVILGMVGQELVPITDNDSWADHRDAMKDVHAVVIFLATVLSTVCVVNAIIWLTHSTSFIQDADDLLWFMVKFPASAVVDPFLVISLLCVGVAVLLQYVIGIADPLASVCFYLGLVIQILVLVWYARALVMNEHRNAQTLKATVPMYVSIVDEAFAAIEQPASSSDI